MNAPYRLYIDQLLICQHLGLQQHQFNFLVLHLHQSYRRMSSTNEGLQPPGDITPMTMSPSGTLRRRPIGSTGSRAEKGDDYESGIQVIDENKEFT